MLPSHTRSHSDSSEKDIMLRPRTGHAFEVQEIIDAKVGLYGAPSPVHRTHTLRSMYQDNTLDARLEIQKRLEIKNDEDYAAIYLKQQKSGQIGKRIDKKLELLNQ